MSSIGPGHLRMGMPTKLNPLHIPLRRDSGIPLYLQIKEGIREALHGAPEDEEALLPPQRDLADRLGVSRNTVGMAYAELQREQLIDARVGKGTLVVRPAKQLESRSRRERLLKTLEHSVEESLSLGFTLDEYAEATEAFLHEKRELLSHIRLVFVECNREQLTYFSEHLSLDPRVVIVPVLLTDIRAKPSSTLPALRSADLVVTSFYHLDELENLLSDGGPPIVGVNLQPEMSTIVQIARIPPTARLGLVAASKQFLAEMGDTLIKMKTDSARVTTLIDGDAETLRHLVGRVDALIVSPSRRKEIEALAGRKPVVEFLFAPDEGSINSIRVALLELKQQRKGKSDHASSDHGTRVS